MTPTPSQPAHQLRFIAVAFLLLAPFISAGCAPNSPDDGASQQVDSPQAEPVESMISMTPMDPPAQPGALAPRLSSIGGALQLSWIEPTETGHRLLFSEWMGSDDDGWRWSEPTEIQRGDNFFANWADVPGIVRDADGRSWAHALRKLGEGTYAYGAQLSRSDAGDDWRDVGLLHDDASETEHGFVSYVLEEGQVRAFWLDGRAMLDGGSMHLRTALLGDEGPGPSELIDERVCECCSTDAAMTASGSIVAYRDRSDGEIRDIAVARGGPEGWSEPALVNDDGWHIFGCPVNGPALAADGEHVALAWFTAANDQPKVKVAFSHDGGQTFGGPILVDGGMDAEAPLGRVDVEMRAGKAYVLWLGARDEAGEIRLQSVSPEGSRGPLQVVAATSQARSAGVPQLAQTGGDLFVAWIETGDPEAEEPSQRLRAARVDP